MSAERAAEPGGMRSAPSVQDNEDLTVTRSRDGPVTRTATAA